VADELRFAEPNSQIKHAGQIPVKKLANHAAEQQVQYRRGLKTALFRPKLSNRPQLASNTLAIVRALR